MPRLSRELAGKFKKTFSLKRICLLRRLPNHATQLPNSYNESHKHGRLSPAADEKGTLVDAFRFSPELFEVRTDVMAALDEAGYQWLSHYSSVDPIHDDYGIEVCGIIHEDDALAIQSLLIRMFPAWRPGCMCHKDYGREPGFKVKVFRDDPRPDEHWETAD